MPAILSTYCHIILKSCCCQSITLYLKAMFYSVHAIVNKTDMIVRESSKGICGTVQIIISEPVFKIGL